jgi:hypothetical protein
VEPARACDREALLLIVRDGLTDAAPTQSVGTLGSLSHPD